MKWKSRVGGCRRFETTLAVALGAYRRAAIYRRKNMFWKFLAAMILGLFFIKFGMMAAVVPLLSGGLQIAILIIVGIALFAAYKSLGRRS